MHNADYKVRYNSFKDFKCVAIDVTIVFKTAYNVSSYSVQLLTCTAHNKHERAITTHGYRCATFHRVWRSAGLEEMPKKHVRGRGKYIDLLYTRGVMYHNCFCVSCHGIWFDTNSSRSGPVCIRTWTWSLLCLLMSRYEKCLFIPRDSADRNVRYIAFKVGLGAWRCFHWRNDIVENGWQDLAALSELISIVSNNVSLFCWVWMYQHCPFCNNM